MGKDFLFENPNKPKQRQRPTASLVAAQISPKFLSADKPPHLPGRGRLGGKYRARVWRSVPRLPDTARAENFRVAIAPRCGLEIPPHAGTGRQHDEYLY